MSGRGGSDALGKWLARPPRTRPVVAWAELRPDPALARSWAERAVDEAEALGLFVELGEELTELGTWPELAAAVARVIADEAYHVDLCTRAAAALGHAAPARVPVRAPREVRSDKRYPLRERIALTLVRGLCVGESLSAAVFAAHFAATTEPTLRVIETEILADEVAHGRLGFAWLHATWTSLPMSTRLLVENALPELFRHVEAPARAWRRPIVERALVEEIVPELERAGVKAWRAWERGRQGAAGV